MRVSAEEGKSAAPPLTVPATVREPVVAEKPQLVERFLKGFFASIAYMKTHRAETSALAAKVLHENLSVVEKDYDFEGPMFTSDGVFDMQAVAVLKKSYVELGTLPSEPPDSALFTTQFVPVK